MSLVITQAKRTPIGKFRGVFASRKATELGANVLSNLKAAVPQPQKVIMGAAVQAGLGVNPCRKAMLIGGLPRSTTCLTVNKGSGSGLAAIALARDYLKAHPGRYQIIAGGMESVTNTPVMQNRLRTGLMIQEGEGELVDSNVYDGMFDWLYKKHFALLAEKWWRQYGITRKEMDDYAYESYKKASKAKFKGVVPVQSIDKDELLNGDVTKGELSGMEPIHKKLGAITKGNSAGFGDGAAAVVMMDDLTAQRENFPVLAEIVGYKTVGADPKDYGTAMVEAVRGLLAENDLKVEDIDLFEIDEIFAVQPLLMMKELDIDNEKVNVKGGSIALGNPIGATSAGMVVNLLHSMKHYGVVAMGVGGGEGMAMLFRKE